MKASAICFGLHTGYSVDCRGCVFDHFDVRKIFLVALKHCPLRNALYNGKEPCTRVLCYWHGKPRRSRRPGKLMRLLEAEPQWIVPNVAGLIVADGVLRVSQCLMRLNDEIIEARNFETTRRGEVGSPQ